MATKPAAKKTVAKAKKPQQGAKAKADKTDRNKKLMVSALEKSLGIVTTACKSTGIARETHYSWYNSDPKYKAEVDEVANITKDFVESKMMASIQNGSDTMMIFFAKTKMKDRGYTERLEIDSKNVTTNLNTEVTKEEAANIMDAIMKRIQ